MKEELKDDIIEEIIDKIKNRSHADARAAVMKMRLTDTQLMVIIEKMYDLFINGSFEGTASFFKLYPPEKVKSYTLVRPTPARYIAAVISEMNDFVEYMRPTINHVSMWETELRVVRIALNDRSFRRAKKVLTADLFREISPYIPSASIDERKRVMKVIFDVHYFSENVWDLFMPSTELFVYLVNIVDEYDRSYYVYSCLVSIIERYLMKLDVDAIIYAVTKIQPSKGIEINWPSYIMDKYNVETFADGIFMNYYGHTASTIISMYNAGIDMTKVRLTYDIIKQFWYHHSHHGLFADLVISNDMTHIFTDPSMNHVHSGYIILGEVVRRCSISFDRIRCNQRGFQEALKHGYKLYADACVQKGLWDPNMDAMSYVAYLNEQSNISGKDKDKVMKIIRRRGIIDRVNYFVDVCFTHTKKNDNTLIV